MANYIAKYALGLVRETEEIYGPIAIGDQKRYSHSPCGDTRERLYVKRVVNEKSQRGVLAYCHNCSEGAVEYESGPPNVTTLTRAIRTPEVLPVLPADYEPANQVALDYIRQYHFTANNAVFFGVGWSENYQRIVLPVRGPEATTIRGCQLRRVGNAGPKYLTMRLNSEPLECVWPAASPAVITEDLLSAWRVWQAGYTAVPLLGAHIRPERLAKMIHDGYKDWVVWLDNDKPEINDAARHMGNMIRALGGTASRHSAKIEAKTRTVEQVGVDIRILQE